MLLSKTSTLASLLLLCICNTYSSNEKVKTPGHMKKLGSHRDPLGVTMIGKFSTPAVFYGHFVKPGKPLWMRSVLDAVEHPGLTNWTDTFFRSKFGSESVRIESTKKEDRKSEAKWVTFRQFLSLYKTEDIYMVHTVYDKMKDLVLVPPSLQCGGFQRAIQSAVLWMGSGSTMSVLHYDELDNMLCVLDGKKDFILIDKAYKEDVEADGFVQSGAYSLVNVLKVDMRKFPRLSAVPWHEVHLDKGDCIFIPAGWYHQVNSSKNRHLAINLWFSHLLWFNSANCSTDQDFHKSLEPITTFGFATPNEVHRSKLLQKVHDKGILLKDVFIESLDTSTEERRSQFFDAIDRYKDSVLSWSELYGFNIDKAIVKFPDIFGLTSSTFGSSEEKVILYEPLPVVDDTLKDDNLEGPEDTVVPDSTCEKKEQLSDGVLSGDSQSTCSDVGSSPLPDDPAAEATHSENDWNHHDLYRQSDMGEIDDSPGGHEHTGHMYYSYTDSDEEDPKTHKSNEKDEL